MGGKGFLSKQQQSFLNVTPRNNSNKSRQYLWDEESISSAEKILRMQEGAAPHGDWKAANTSLLPKQPGHRTEVLMRSRQRGRRGRGAGGAPGDGGSP